MKNQKLEEVFDLLSNIENTSQEELELGDLDSPNRPALYRVNRWAREALALLNASED